MPRTSRSGRARRAAILLAAAAALPGLGCGPAPAVEDPPRALPVDVYADTGRTIALRAAPPAPSSSPARGSAWLARVSPSREAPVEVPPPDPTPETLGVTPADPPALVVADGLKPPLPRGRAPLAVPPGARGSVELDVRVDEQGTVAEVRWADGTREPAMVRAAIECARAMRFYPAQRAGRPVAVWCRQRFDFGDGDP